MLQMFLAVFAALGIVSKVVAEAIDLTVTGQCANKNSCQALEIAGGNALVQKKISVERLGESQQVDHKDTQEERDTKDDDDRLKAAYGDDGWTLMPKQNCAGMVQHQALQLAVAVNTLQDCKDLCTEDCRSVLFDSQTPRCWTYRNPEAAGCCGHNGIGSFQCHIAPAWTDGWARMPKGNCEEMSPESIIKSAVVTGSLTACKALCTGECQSVMYDYWYSKACWTYKAREDQHCCRHNGIKSECYTYMAPTTVS